MAGFWYNGVFYDDPSGGGLFGGIQPKDALGQALLASTTSPTATPPTSAAPLVTSATGSERGTQFTTGGAPPDTGPGAEGGFRIRLQKPDGSFVFSRDIDEIDRLINAGALPIHDDGSVAQVRAFNGGTLIDGLPINTVLTGTISRDQFDALRAAGLPLPSDLQIVGGAGTGTTSTPPASGATAPASGTSQAGGPAIPQGDTDNLIKFLIQQALTQGAQGQDNLQLLLNDIHDSYVFNQAATEDRLGRQEALVNALMGRANPALDKIFSQIGQGLSPEANAALRQQAIEAPERAYQGQVSALKSDLARRGALSGDRPGALDQLVQGYAPLMTSRDATRSGLMSQAILADEDARKQSYGLGLNALGTAGSLTGLAGDIFSPNAFLSANQGGLANQLNAIQARTNAGMQGLGLASTLTSTLATPDDHSLRNALLGGLLGAGSSLFSNPGLFGRS